MADLNGDRTPDLAVVNANNDGRATVVLGNGDGTFKAPVAYPVGSNPTAIVSADVNGDGRQDLIVANESLNASTGRSVSVLLGNGDGTFENSMNTFVSTNPVALAMGDFNSDGKLDLAVADQQVDVFLGNGDGTFRSAPIVLPGSHPSSLATADFNRDGKLDLAVVTSGGVAVLSGNGDGTFSAPVNVAIGSGADALAVGDLRENGLIDLAVTHFVDQSFGSAGFVGVLLGSGRGTFGSVMDSRVGLAPQTLAVGDLDGDGRLDVVVGNDGGTLTILRGNGDGTFGTALTIAVGGTPMSLATADLNGDGKLDLVSANWQSSTVTVLLNQTR